MLELAESFKYRVYYAARDGMAITLYALLCEKSNDEIQQVLNEVKLLNCSLSVERLLCLCLKHGFRTLAFSFCWSLPFDLKINELGTYY